MVMSTDDEVDAVLVLDIAVRDGTKLIAELDILRSVTAVGNHQLTFGTREWVMAMMMSTRCSPLGSRSSWDSSIPTSFMSR